MKAAPLPEPWAALDGARWWPSGEAAPWVLRVGRYVRADGPVALWVESAGERIDTITVNLEGDAPVPGFGRCHVKLHGWGRDQFLTNVLATRLLEPDGKVRHASGFVLEYAEEWRMVAPEDVRRRRLELDAQVREEEERRLALDAAKRLNGGRLPRAPIPGEVEE